MRLVLLLFACSSGPSSLRIDLQVASGERPLAKADRVALSVSDAGGNTLAVRQGPPAASSLALDPLPAGMGYSVSLLGTFGGDAISRGRSCRFDLDASTPPVPLYFGEVGHFAATGQPMHPTGVAIAAGGDALLVGGGVSERYRPAVNRFEPDASLKVVRASPVLALLGDGAILAVGGAAALPAVEVYRDGTWTAVPTLIPPSLSDTAAVSLGDGSVLVSGGRAGANPLDNAWLIGSTQVPQSPMVTARAGHTLTLAAGGRTASVFVIGGEGPSGFVDDVELFDPVTVSFSSFGLKLMTPRRGHTATRLASGRVLVAGGVDASGQSLSSAEVLDPVAHRFFATDPMTTARTGHSATLLPSGHVLLTGGGDASAEIFDPDLGQAGGFVPTQPLVGARSGHSAVELCDGTLLIVGGGAGAERYVP